MKNLLFCIAVFILFCQKGFSQLKIDSLPIIEGKYKICNIDSVQSVYIIYAQKDNSIIKIASSKGSAPDCSPIETGRYYDLKLQSRVYRTASKLHIEGVMVNGVLIKLEGGNVSWDLFSCLNLKGLCVTSLNGGYACGTN